MLDKAKFTCDYTDLTAKVPGVLQTFHRSLELVLFLKSCSKWHLKLFLFQTFCLNWGKVTCDNSKEHQAVKYTDLGPFSPGWMLKCKSNENKGMPSTLVACIRVSHFKTQESIEPLWNSAPYQVDLQVITFFSSTKWIAVLVRKNRRCSV